MTLRNCFYIDGRWVASRSGEHMDVINASTEERMGAIPLGGAFEIDMAVAAARNAFESWSKLLPSERAVYLRKIADGLQVRATELAEVICAEVGMPIRQTRAIQVAGPIAQWRSVADLVDDFVTEQRIGNSLITQESVGVVAAITPWNYPLHQITLKVAAALGAGCTVVLKPSEIAPLNAFILAEVIEAAGLPAGVFNLVTGLGSTVGEALSAHPDVAMVSFTGSTLAGKRVASRCAESVKRVALELGGKSASIMLDDADFSSAVKATLNACFLNAGQTCSALTRLLVPASRYSEVKTLALKHVSALVPGDPFLDTTRLGPLTSAAQRDRVLTFIKKGLAQGAELIAGGTERPPGLERGYYVQPTILGNVLPDSVLGQEEVFGPVLSIICYDDEDDAVRIANGTAFGLSGAVWSDSDAHAMAIARRLRTGQVTVNGGAFNALAPFGGFKQSGIGREGGAFGIDEFLEYKAYQMPT
ncbi:aldehyde dehydrogenase family protein [Pseudomonas sp. NPDC088368]|uniref:aldehyde dehydrogenase family protein n=1 Tax=Pseudomonas sp. NPDC088368 TaxID=3364453 RepID=UPI00382B9DFA